MDDRVCGLVYVITNYKFKWGKFENRKEEQLHEVTKVLLWTFKAVNGVAELTSERRCCCRSWTMPTLVMCEGKWGGEGGGQLHLQSFTYIHYILHNMTRLWCWTLQASTEMTEDLITPHLPFPPANDPLATSISKEKVVAICVSAHLNWTHTLHTTCAAKHPPT